jgi:hypothetical protein
MGEGVCGWAGCSSGAEATLDGRALCRNHFYDMAGRRLAEYRAQLQRTEPAWADRIGVTKFLSEIINETTNLVASAKFLGHLERDQFLGLSLAAAELYKRIQRNPRLARNMPMLVYRETESAGRKELTNTINISKRGACIATSRFRDTGEKIWIEKPGNHQRTLVRIAWVKKNAPSEFLMGLEILDNEDFWNLELA